MVTFGGLQLKWGQGLKQMDFNIKLKLTNIATNTRTDLLWATRLNSRFTPTFIFS